MAAKYQHQRKSGSERRRRKLEEKISVAEIAWRESENAISGDMALAAEKANNGGESNEKSVSEKQHENSEKRSINRWRRGGGESGQQRRNESGEERRKSGKIK